MIKFQQSHALTSHFETFWSIVTCWNAVCHLKANHETIISKAHNFVLYSTSCEMVDEKKLVKMGLQKWAGTAAGLTGFVE